MLMDMPSDASLTTHSVRHGDVLIFATDGLWDNLSAADVLKTVSRYMTGFHGWTSSSDTKGNSRGALEASVNLKNITAENGLGTKDGSIQALLAVAITSEAKMASMDTKRDGPFAREVHKYYPSEDFHGGKVDDICVVVAVVVKND